MSWVERKPTDQYNIAAVRSLLRAAFTSKELKRFCQDRAVFRPVLDRFGSDPNLEDMTDIVVEYCLTRDLISRLLSEIRKVNPRQYERIRPQLYESKEIGNIHSGPARTQPERPTIPTTATQRRGCYAQVGAARFALVLSAILASALGVLVLSGGYIAMGSESDRTWLCICSAALLLLPLLGLVWLWIRRK